jgi:hypothetical protein
MIVTYENNVESETREVIENSVLKSFINYTN